MLTGLSGPPSAACKLQTQDGSGGFSLSLRPENQDSGRWKPSLRAGEDLCPSSCSHTGRG